MRRLPLFASLLILSAPAAADIDAVVESYRILNPSPADFSRARAELEAGHYESAAHLYDGLADGTANPNVSLLAGYANLGAGRIERAEGHFARGLWLDRRSVYARLGLGLSALARGDKAAASAQLAALELAMRREGPASAEPTGRAVASLRRAIAAHS